LVFWILPKLYGKLAREAKEPHSVQPVVIIKVIALPDHRLDAYLIVLGDISAAASAKKVFVIIEKLFTSLFGQPLTFAKIVPPKIFDHDATTQFVVFLSPERAQLSRDVNFSLSISCKVGAIFNEFEAAKPFTDIDPISNSYRYCPGAGTLHRKRAVHGVHDTTKLVNKLMKVHILVVGLRRLEENSVDVSNTVKITALKVGKAH
jgi:hypothetical protein